MKYLPRTIGLYQAAGLILYVSLFATVIQLMQQSAFFQNFEPEPPLGIVLFLLAFIISAIICSSIFFAYPIILFFGDKKNEAFKIIMWSLGWLLIFFLFFLVIISFLFIE